MQVQREFLTVEEVAEILGFNRISTYRLIQSGKIQSHRFSRNRIRISKEDLQDYITKAKVQMHKK